MDDRELLELAAKAAGLKIGGTLCQDGSWSSDIEYSFKPSSGIGSATTSSGWNPLTDDGDALRLAVKLNMLCDFGSHGCLVEAKEGNGPCTEVGDYRRAIVRAAAEIGRAM